MKFRNLEIKQCYFPIFVVLIFFSKGMAWDLIGMEMSLILELCQLEAQGRDGEGRGAQDDPLRFVTAI